MQIRYGRQCEARTRSNRNAASMRMTYYETCPSRPLELAQEVLVIEKEAYEKSKDGQSVRRQDGVLELLDHACLLT